jgi:hypothetical protein
MNEHGHIEIAPREHRDNMTQVRSNLVSTAYVFGVVCGYFYSATGLMKAKMMSRRLVEKKPIAWSPRDTTPASGLEVSGRRRVEGLCPGQGHPCRTSRALGAPRRWC